GEHSRHTGFEGERLSLLLPRPRVGLGRHQVAARENESLRVAQHPLGQPFASRPGPDENEDGVGLLRSTRAVVERPERHAFYVTLALDPGDFRSGTQTDVRGLLD